MGTTKNDPKLQKKQGSAKRRGQKETPIRVMWIYSQSWPRAVAICRQALKKALGGVQQGIPCASIPPHILSISEGPIHQGLEAVLDLDLSYGFKRGIKNEHLKKGFQRSVVQSFQFHAFWLPQLLVAVPSRKRCCLQTK